LHERCGDHRPDRVDAAGPDRTSSGWARYRL